MLYPHFKPLGVRKDWDCTGISRADAAKCFARYSGRTEEPTDAIAWWDDSGALKRLVADYSDGRRADLRIGRNGFRLSHTTPSQQDKTNG